MVGWACSPVATNITETTLVISGRGFVDVVFMNYTQDRRDVLEALEDRTLKWGLVALYFDLSTGALIMSVHSLIHDLKFCQLEANASSA